MSFYNKKHFILVPRTVGIGPRTDSEFIICRFFGLQIYNISTFLKARRSDFFDEFLRF